MAKITKLIMCRFNFLYALSTDILYCIAYINLSLHAKFFSSKMVFGCQFTVSRLFDSNCMQCYSGVTR